MIIIRKIQENQSKCQNIVNGAECGEPATYVLRFTAKGCNTQLHLCTNCMHQVSQQLWDKRKLWEQTQKAVCDEVWEQM